MLWTCSRNAALSQEFGITCCSRRGCELVKTWEMCAIRQSNWYSHATSEHKHEHSHCHKGHNSGSSGCSQMTSNVSKTETEEQDNDSYQHEQDQECDGDEVVAIKARAEVVLMDLFQVWNEMTQSRSMLAERERKRRQGRKEKVVPKERDGPKANG